MGKGRTGKGAGSSHSASSGICLPQTLEVKAGEEKRGDRAREGQGMREEKGGGGEGEREDTHGERQTAEAETVKIQR